MIKNLLNLFFPEVCRACSNHLSDNELQICTNCRHDLPLTNFHSDPENAVHKMLYGRVKLEQATALLHFSKKGKSYLKFKYYRIRVFHKVCGNFLASKCDFMRF